MDAALGASDFDGTEPVRALGAAAIVARRFLGSANGYQPDSKYYSMEDAAGDSHLQPAVSSFSLLLRMRNDLIGQYIREGHGTAPAW